MESCPTEVPAMELGRPGKDQDGAVAAGRRRGLQETRRPSCRQRLAALSLGPLGQASLPWKGDPRTSFLLPG